MALFNAEDLHSPEPELKTIAFDFLVLPDGEDVPELDIKVNPVTRKAAKKAAALYRNVNMKSGMLINDPLEYCKHILEKAYVSDTLILGGGKNELFIVLDRNPEIAGRLSGKLSDVFEGSEIELKKQEEDDEKN